MEQLEALDMQVLLGLLNNAPEDRTVTRIARALKTEKYKVSRSMIALEDAELVDRSEPRHPKLTEKGLTEAKRIQERADVSLSHLLYEGMSMENAQHDAYAWARDCTDEYIEIVRRSVERCRIKYELRNKITFSGGELCRLMKDSRTLLPFLFYRENMQNSSNILSMANEGFEHPCTLIVKDGVGEIKLRVTPMSAKSKINDQFLSGHVTNLKYYIAGQFANAVWDGECYTIPADAISFVNIGDSMGQILHGTVCVQMDCTVGVQHMPTSKAMFTLLI